ncbi:hypothetical protein Tco_0928927 [Tanacetum coccineum]
MLQEDLSFGQLVSHLRIEETLRRQDNDIRLRRGGTGHFKRIARSGIRENATDGGSEEIGSKDIPSQDMIIAYEVGRLSSFTSYIVEALASNNNGVFQVLEVHLLRVAMGVHVGGDAISSASKEDKPCITRFYYRNLTFELHWCVIEVGNSVYLSSEVQGAKVLHLVETEFFGRFQEAWTWLLHIWY